MSENASGFGKLQEPARQLDIIASYQTAVVGGGVAGIAAALASARSGAKTLLIERDWLPGGLSTLGLITIFLPLCDGYGKQVIYGIGEELLKLSISYGAEEEHFKKPLAWLNCSSVKERTKLRYQAQFPPYIFAICAERLLRQAGVDILYGMSVCGVQCERNKIRALITESKSGRQAILADTVVDSSGDANISWFANAETQVFSAGNILAGWYYYFSDGKVRLRMMGAAEKPDDMDDKKRDGIRDDDEVLLKDRRFTGLDGVELSEMVQLSRKSVLESVDREREKHPDYYPVTVPVIPQVRMTRRIEGEYVQDSTEAFKHYEDSIGMTGDWRKSGPVYEIPLRCLYNKNICNLITAGRCISVTDSMWDITRVIPTCAVTGQAAGTAAAIAALDGTCDISQVSISKLQDKLREDGVRLFLSEIGIYRNADRSTDCSPIPHQ